MTEVVTSLVSIQGIQDATGSSRSFVYAEILPLLDVRKIGRSTKVTRESLAAYLANLPRVRFKPKPSIENRAD